MLNPMANSQRTNIPGETDIPGENHQTAVRSSDDSRNSSVSFRQRSLSVPGANRSLLSVPTLSEASRFARENAERLKTADCVIQDRSLRYLREWARELLFHAACKYTAELAGEDVPTLRAGKSPAGLCFVSGHQPSLFHPGVWVKNFAAHALAEETQGWSLNLVVDNDMISRREVSLPDRDGEQIRYKSIPFDHGYSSCPWEEARVNDRTTFLDFGESVDDHMQRWQIDPMLADWWPGIVQAEEQTGRLACALTAARYRCERKWGVRNLELPISRMCQTEPFLWFMAHLLCQAHRFCMIHNQVLGEYRRVYRIRSQTHPVPELKLDGDWLEVPFWVWSQSETERRRMFVRHGDGEVALSDGRTTIGTLPMRCDNDAATAVDVLKRLQQEQGLRLRTRALTTTLFTRLFLADLFVHGIGGSKYDEMTDQIIVRFFELQPPEFLTLSATLYLPLSTPDQIESMTDLANLQQSARDLHYNPDRYLTEQQQQTEAALIAEKRRLIRKQELARARQGTRAQRRSWSRENLERMRRFHAVRLQLASLAEGELSKIQRIMADRQRWEESRKVLENREYSIGLFPELTIREFMTETFV